MLNQLPSELQQSLIIPIELAINKALSLDPATQTGLEPFQGKVLALKLVSTKRSSVLTTFVRILDNEICFSLTEDMPFDACLEGTLSHFTALALSDNKSDSLINSDIDLSGDSEFAIALTGLIENLDLDWEALIAPLTGGIVAHQLGSGIRSMMRWSKQALSTQKTAVKDYLETETGLLAAAAEIGSFANQVDEAKLAADRLSARVEQLLKKQSGEKES